MALFISRMLALRPAVCISRRWILSAGYRESDGWSSRPAIPAHSVPTSITSPSPTPPTPSHTTYLTDINRSLMESNTVDYVTLDAYVDGLTSPEDVVATANLIERIRTRSKDPSQLRYSTVYSFLRHCIHNNQHNLALQCIANKDVFLMNPSSFIYNLLLDYFIDSDDWHAVSRTVVECYRQDEIANSPLAKLLVMYSVHNLLTRRIESLDDQMASLGGALAEACGNGNSSLHRNYVIIGRCLGNRPDVALRYVSGLVARESVCEISGECVRYVDECLGRRAEWLEGRLNSDPERSPDEVEDEDFVAQGRRPPREELKEQREVWEGLKTELISRGWLVDNLDIEAPILELISPESLARAERDDALSNYDSYRDYVVDRAVLDSYRRGLAKQKPSVYHLADLTKGTA